jgi:hypothetical protein
MKTKEAIQWFKNTFNNFRVTPWGISRSISVKDAILLKLKADENTGLV